AQAWRSEPSPNSASESSPSRRLAGAQRIEAYSHGVQFPGYAPKRKELGACEPNRIVKAHLGMHGYLAQHSILNAYYAHRARSVTAYTPRGVATRDDPFLVPQVIPRVVTKHAWRDVCRVGSERRRHELAHRVEPRVRLLALAIRPHHVH